MSNSACMYEIVYVCLLIHEWELEILVRETSMKKKECKYICINEEDNENVCG